MAHKKLMKGNVLFRAPSLGDLFAPLSRICRAGVRLPGWLEEPVPRCPHPAEPSPPSTSQFTGCEPLLGEETGLNLGQGLGINWGFMGSFMFLIHRPPSGSLRLSRGGQSSTGPCRWLSPGLSRCPWVSAWWDAQCFPSSSSSSFAWAWTTGSDQELGGR